MEAAQLTSHSQTFQAVSEAAEAFVLSQYLLPIGAAKSKEVNFPTVLLWLSLLGHEPSKESWLDVHARGTAGLYRQCHISN